MHYISIDEDLSQIAAKKYCGHLWYLSAELCSFAFFNETVPLETKKKNRFMLQTTISLSELTSHTQRLILSPDNATELLE